MQDDHDDPEKKAFRTAFFQNVYPAAEVYDEVKNLKIAFDKTLVKLQNPALTDTEYSKLLRRAERLNQKINSRLREEQPTLAGLRLFNQQMGALTNALTAMGSDITEAKVRSCLESLGLSPPRNEQPLQASSESTEPIEAKPIEAKMIEALQSMSLANTQGSSSTSISSDAEFKKDEPNKNS